MCTRDILSEEIKKNLQNYSEKVLARGWDLTEEDKAWKNL